MTLMQKCHLQREGSRTTNHDAVIESNGENDSSLQHSTEGLFRGKNTASKHSRSNVQSPNIHTNILNVIC